MVILMEVLSGSATNFEFKPEPKTENYRRFRVDELPPLTSQPEKKLLPEFNWRQLKADYELKTGKILRPVQRRGGDFSLPPHCTCEHCGAPFEYLYLNDGRKGNQIRCKVCGRLSTSNRVRRESKAEYFCPHCGCPLGIWKQSPHETIYKCFRYDCPHYLANEQKLTAEEHRCRHEQKFDPNYKLHYQYREYHLDSAELKCLRPGESPKVDLSRIHNTYHVVGLVLSCFINLGLSSRQTRDLLYGFFGLKISHQTVINYVNAAAAPIAPWLDRNLPQPGIFSAADETYLIVENQCHYTWFIIDAISRAICGYNLSDDRGAIPALATLYSAFGPPEQNINRHFVLIRDGLPSYDNAVMAYNQAVKQPVITTQTVVGLENLDEVSHDFRPFKQLVERTNRTYKFHTRPRAGFTSLEGACSLTTLFVAFYNYLRPHSSIKRTPIALKELAGVTNYPKQWEILLKIAA